MEPLLFGIGNREGGSTPPPTPFLCPVDQGPDPSLSWARRPFRAGNASCAQPGPCPRPPSPPSHGSPGQPPLPDTEPHCATGAGGDRLHDQEGGVQPTLYQNVKGEDSSSRAPPQTHFPVGQGGEEVDVTAAAPRGFDPSFRVGIKEAGEKDRGVWSYSFTSFIFCSHSCENEDVFSFHRGRLCVFGVALCRCLL